MKIDVSVLTPSYGYGRFIGEAISSCLNQPSISVQAVVQDAGSDDDTQRVVQDLSRRYPTSISWETKPDRGQSEALNRALKRAEGRWIGWLNADEFYLPGGLTRLIRMGDSSGADVVYGDVVFVDDEGKLLRLKSQHPFNDFVLRNYGTFIASCGIVIRRSALPAEPWDPDLRLLMDRDLFMKLSRSGRVFQYDPYPVSAFRVHSTQVSGASSDNFAADYRRIYERYGLVSRPGRWAGWALHAFYKKLHRGYRKESLASFLKGRQMSWLDDHEGQDSMSALLRRCYGITGQTTPDND